MEVLAKIAKILFLQKSPSQMFDFVLNTPLVW